MTNFVRFCRSLPTSRITFSTSFLSVSSVKASSHFQRNFFEDYHHLEVVKELTLKKQTQMEGAEQFKTSLTKHFNESGLKNIIHKDIDQYLLLAKSKEEMKETANMLAALLYDHLRFDAKLMPPILILFFKKCYLLNCVDEAKNLWDLNLMRFGTNVNGKLMRLYLDILHSNGCYQDVLDAFDKSKFLFTDDIRGLQCLSLVINSCYRIGTKESLKKSIEEVFLIKEGKHQLDDLKFIAMHAFNLKEYDLSMMFVKKLQDQTSTKHPFHRDLELMIQIRTGKLQEAVAKLRSNFSLGGGCEGKGLILYPIVQELVQEVKMYDDGGKLLKELLTIVAAIDSETQKKIVNRSLDDMLPLKHSPAVKSN